MWLDVNNDSWEDLYIATGTSMYTDYPNVTKLVETTRQMAFPEQFEDTLPLQDISWAINWENELTFSVAWETTTKTEPWILSHIAWDPGQRCTMAWSTKPLGPSDAWFRTWGHLDAIGSVASVWQKGTPSSRDPDLWFSNTCPKTANDGHFWVGKPPRWTAWWFQWASGEQVSLSLKRLTGAIVLNEEGLVESPSLGCTYAVACNYNAEATEDDGSL